MLLDSPDATIVRIDVLTDAVRRSSAFIHTWRQKLPKSTVTVNDTITKRISEQAEKCVRVIHESLEVAEQGRVFADITITLCESLTLREQSKTVLADLSSVSGEARQSAHRMKGRFREIKMEVLRTRRDILKQKQDEVMEAPVPVSRNRKYPSATPQLEHAAKELEELVREFVLWWSEMKSLLSSTLEEVINDITPSKANAADRELIQQEARKNSARYLAYIEKIGGIISLLPQQIKLDGSRNVRLNKRSTSVDSSPLMLERSNSRPLLSIFCNFTTFAYLAETDGRSLESFIITWQSADIVTCLANYRTIVDRLWDVVQSSRRQLKLDFATTKSLSRVLELDTDKICEHLVAIFQDTHKSQLFFSKRGAEAQSLLSLLQTYLELPSLDSSFRQLFVGAVVKLSRASSQYPNCLVLKDVKPCGPYSVAFGTFGDVWQGEVQGHAVAIKVLRVPKTDIDAVLKTFAHEIVVWTQLSHSCILPLYGVYHWQEKICLISPWMRHGNIVKFLKDNPDANRCLLITDVALGLEYLHSGKPKIVHGDLKGVNILVTESGRACLADFGLTVPRDSRIPAWASLGSAPQGGSIRWMAPELFREDIVNNTSATDVYAFACSCWEIFAGTVPFPKANDASIMYAVLAGQRPRPPPDNVQRDRGLDTSMWALIESCWAQSPADRPTAREIVKVLRARPGPPDARAPHRWDRDFASRLRCEARESPIFLSPELMQELVERTNAQDVQVGGTPQKTPARGRRLESAGVDAISSSMRKLNISLARKTTPSKTTPSKTVTPPSNAPSPRSERHSTNPETVVQTTPSIEEPKQEQPPAENRGGWLGWLGF